jgi:hypothetical protein
MDDKVRFFRKRIEKEYFLANYVTRDPIEFTRSHYDDSHRLQLTSQYPEKSAGVPSPFFA